MNVTVAARRAERRSICIYPLLLILQLREEGGRNLYPTSISGWRGCGEPLIAASATPLLKNLERGHGISDHGC